MSVLIKGMTMPECCAMCPMCHRNFDGNETRLACYALSAWCIEDEDGLEKCPLVELPEKHGRLIDADATMKQWGLDKATKYGNETAEQQHFSYSTMMMYEIVDILDDAPVLIEAEGK